MKKKVNAQDEKNTVLKQFQKIPSIGKAASLDLWNIGLRDISDIAGKNPSLLYKQLNPNYVIEFCCESQKANKD